MNTKGVNFQPSKRGQFSAAVDTNENGSASIDFIDSAPAARLLRIGEVDSLVNGISDTVATYGYT
jgi:hypothetical protein